ncbi:MAG: hypothetical protein ACI83P_001638 [Janthinobacterium sp.]|jgi:hypothetical protein
MSLFLISILAAVKKYARTDFFGAGAIGALTGIQCQLDIILIPASTGCTRRIHAWCVKV